MIVYFRFLEFSFDCMNNTSICVSNLSKCYHIYNAPQDRLKQSIFPRLRNMLGLPNIQYFQPFWALQGVSFNINKGEAIGVIGRNGSGKSTLLQLLCGTLTRSSGDIQLDGRVAALLELGAGFNPEFTGRENVYMNAAIYGMSQVEIDRRFDAIVAFADIGEFIEQPVKFYSSGMFVRLAFAVIAHLDADVLIVDEALAVGDAVFTQKCMRFLRDFAQQGTLLFVSHDTSAVLNLCSRAIWLDHGKLRADGSAREVVEAYHAYLYECQAQEVKPVLPPSTAPSADLPSEPNEVRDFGLRGVSIVSTVLTNSDNQVVSVCAGEVPVSLSVVCIQHQILSNMIVGFLVKDRLGQVVFAENTLARAAIEPLVFTDAVKFMVVFNFVMPVLMAGEYVIDVAVAEGTQINHLQHHWLYGAVVFRAMPVEVCHGLIHIPMRSIEVTTVQ